jgi:mannitol/fructose-specific phosphotransferase system IIA component (Ntr-type)
MPIPLNDLLDQRQIALSLHARDRSGALREIVQLLAANGKLAEPERFLEQLLARETARPSAIEQGVVFPHLRSDLVDEIVLGCGRSRSGVVFDGEPANLIFVIGVPQRLANEYLFVVGALARLLHDEKVRHGLLRAKTADQFIQALQPGS